MEQKKASKRVEYKRPLISSKNKEELKKLINKVDFYKPFYNSYKLLFEIDEDINVEIQIRLNINDKEVVLVGVDINDMLITIDNFFLGMKVSNKWD